MSKKTYLKKVIKKKKGGKKSNKTLQFTSPEVEIPEENASSYFSHSGRFTSTFIHKLTIKEREKSNIE